jgi:hypothetical protein
MLIKDDQQEKAIPLKEEEIQKMLSVKEVLSKDLIKG